jgi:hypothetical protein
MVFLLVIAPNNAGATIPEYIVATKSDKDNITIYAKKMEGLYYDFKIDFNGRIFTRPFWMNVTNPTYPPQIYYEDINKDDRKELIIILTKGYGTGVLDQEVNVFHIDNNQFGEVLVDHPIAIVNKNIKASLDPNKAELTIGREHYVINVKELKLPPEPYLMKLTLEALLNIKSKIISLLLFYIPSLLRGLLLEVLLSLMNIVIKCIKQNQLLFKLKIYKRFN